MCTVHIVSNKIKPQYLDGHVVFHDHSMRGFCKSSGVIRKRQQRLLAHRASYTSQPLILSFCHSSDYITVNLEIHEKISQSVPEL